MQPGSSILEECAECYFPQSKSDCDDSYQGNERAQRQRARPSFWGQKLSGRKFHYLEVVWMQNVPGRLMCWYTRSPLGGAVLGGQVQLQEVGG